MDKNRSRLAYTAAVATSVIFGLSFLFTKRALDHLDTFQLLGFRFAVASLFLTVLKVTGLVKLQIRRSILRELITIALLQPVLYFILETIGVKLTTTSEAGVIIALVPMAATIFAVVLLKESLTPYQWVSIAFSISGVILIVVSRGSGESSSQLLGIAALIGAVVAAGLYNVLSRKVAAISSPIATTFVMMWVGAIVFNAAGLYTAIRQGGFVSYFSDFLNLSVIADIAYLGILSSVCAFFLLNYALSKMEASKTAVFLNLIPVVSVAAGIVFRGESFRALQAIGALLILIGIWGTNRRPNKGKKDGVTERNTPISAGGDL